MMFKNYFFAFAFTIYTSLAGAFTVSFDDIDASAGDIGLDTISPAYQGLSWSNFNAYASFPGFDGFNNGIVSGANGAYSGGQIFGADVEPVIGKIQSADLFDAENVYLGAGYYDGLQVTVEGLRGGTVLDSLTFMVGTAGANLSELSFLGIDELDFFSTATADTKDSFGCGAFNCTQFTIDDLNITPSVPTTSVPEPSPLSLLIPSALVVACRKKLQKFRNVNT